MPRICVHATPQVEKMNYCVCSKIARRPVITLIYDWVVASNLLVMYRVMDFQCLFIDIAIVKYKKHIFILKGIVALVLLSCHSKPEWLSFHHGKQEYILQCFFPCIHLCLIPKYDAANLKMHKWIWYLRTTAEWLSYWVVWISLT